MTVLRVFLVENSRVMVDTVSALLDEVGGIALVGVAQNAKSAIRELSHVSCDLVILDLLLDDSSGWSVLHEPLCRVPEREFVVLSSFASSEVETAARDLGVAAVLNKDNGLLDLWVLLNERVARLEGRPDPREGD